MAMLLGSTATTILPLARNETLTLNFSFIFTAPSHVFMQGPSIAQARDRRAQYSNALSNKVAFRFANSGDPLGMAHPARWHSMIYRQLIKNS